MARWEITKSERRIGVMYVNLQTGKRFDCGDQRPDTPVSMITDWWAEHAAPGDIAVINGRVALQKFDEARA